MLPQCLVASKSARRGLQAYREALGGGAGGTGPAGGAGGGEAAQAGAQRPMAECEFTRFHNALDFTHGQKGAVPARGSPHLWPQRGAGGRRELQVCPTRSAPFFARKLLQKEQSLGCARLGVTWHQHGSAGSGSTAAAAAAAAALLQPSPTHPHPIHTGTPIGR